MAPGPDFPRPESATAADLAKALMAGADAYGICRTDKAALVEWIKRGGKE